MSNVPSRGWLRARSAVVVAFSLIPFQFPSIDVWRTVGRGEAVIGDGRINLNLGTMTGTAAFTGLERWTQASYPGRQAPARCYGPSGGRPRRSPLPTHGGRDPYRSWAICLTPPPSLHGILTPMQPFRRSVSDEVRGLRATGSFVAGDFEDAVAELEQTSSRYLAGFLFRCSLVAPTLSMRLAWRLVRQRGSGGIG